MSTSAANVAGKTILVVANETVGGRELLDAVRERANPDTQIHPGRAPEPPQERPGGLQRLGVRGRPGQGRPGSRGHPEHGGTGDRRGGRSGPVHGDSATPWASTALRRSSSRPTPRLGSGWLRRDLIDRIREATGLPVTHIVQDIDSEGLPFHVTLAVANRTASGDELLEALAAKAKAHTDTEHRQVFIVLIPAEGGSGKAIQRARTRLKLVLDRLRVRDLLCGGAGR